MTSMEEVNENQRLVPWFRYAKGWPDPWECEIIWLLALTALRLQEACLVGNPAPVVEEMWQRMSHPQVGDIVLETGTRWHTDWPERALGRLIDFRKGRSRFDDEYVVEPLFFAPGTAITTWSNATFMAVPVDETAYLGKRGPVVFTKDSLIRGLSGSGFELKDPTPS